MEAMLSDLHHKDGTHYSTGRLEIRKYSGEFQYYKTRNFDVIYSNFYVLAGSML